ncbi:ribosome maturation factor [bacterium]|nr:ribosome maturation factor [bacterium]MBU1994801.1 ribosome maturation factor [bacterium]
MSLESDINSLVESVGLELYDTCVVSENDETIFRVSVTAKDATDGGVNMDKCVELTHLISPLLDVTPPVSGNYRLEVGSPGIERKLSTLKHFTKSIGENVFCTLKNKEKLKGKVLKVNGNKIFIDVEGEEVETDFSEITKAKTYFEW